MIYDMSNYPQLEHEETTLEGHIGYVWRQAAGTRRAFDMPTETAEDLAVEAVINHGRWLVRCPFCTGAEIVDLKDLRFFCLLCKNAEAGGRFIRVRLPAGHVKAARALEYFPEQMRNWPQ